MTKKIVVKQIQLVAQPKQQPQLLPQLLHAIALVRVNAMKTALAAAPTNVVRVVIVKFRI